MPRGIYERTAEHKVRTPEMRAKISAALKGYKHTPEAKANMSAGNKGRVLTAEMRAKRSADKRTHGMSLTPIYMSWASAKSRCNNPNAQAYARYGGRGIEMRLTFEEFLKEMGERPEGDYSIDRIDNDGHYERGNLRWATRLEQRMNQRARKTTDSVQSNYISRWWRGLDSRIGAPRGAGPT